MEIRGRYDSIGNKNQQSRAQTIGNETSQWSQNNKMKLNEEKCEELRISFSKVPRDFTPDTY